MKDDAWMESWDLFTKAMERQLQGGATNEELSRFFGGKTVRWQGVIEHMGIDKVAPNVEVALPRRDIKFGDGREASLDGLSLLLADSAIDDWRALSPGTEVRFSATLGQGISPFLPIEIKTLKSGHTVVLIRLSDATPIVD